MTPKNPSMPPQPPDDVVVLPIGAVAAFIGCGRGRVERAVLRNRLAPHVRGQRGQPFFAMADVERLKKEFEAEDSQPTGEQ